MAATSNRMRKQLNANKDTVQIRQAVADALGIGGLQRSGIDAYAIIAFLKAALSPPGWSLNRGKTMLRKPTRSNRFVIGGLTSGRMAHPRPRVISSRGPSTLGTIDTRAPTGEISSSSGKKTRISLRLPRPGAIMWAIFT